MERRQDLQFDAMVRQSLSKPRLCFIVVEVEKDSGRVEDSGIGMHRNEFCNHLAMERAHGAPFCQHVGDTVSDLCHEVAGDSVAKESDVLVRELKKVLEEFAAIKTAASTCGLARDFITDFSKQHTQDVIINELKELVPHAEAGEDLPTADSGIGMPKNELTTSNLGTTCKSGTKAHMETKVGEERSLEGWDIGSTKNERTDNLRTTGKSGIQVRSSEDLGIGMTKDELVSKAEGSDGMKLNSTTNEGVMSHGGRELLAGDSGSGVPKNDRINNLETIDKTGTEAHRPHCQHFKDIMQYLSDEIAGEFAGKGSDVPAKELKEKMEESAATKSSASKSEWARGSITGYSKQITQQNEKVRCKMCHSVKDASREFSKAQLQRFAKHGSVCRKCTGV